MRTFPLLAAGALALVSATVPAQPASFSVFGTACSDPNGRSASIGNTGLPQIGTSFSIDYTGPNFTFNAGQQRMQPNLMVGLSSAAVPIPTSVLTRQVSGCVLWQTAEIILPMPPDPNNPVYQSSLKVTVPNDPSIIGVNFFAQWYALFWQCGIFSCNPEYVITSDAASVTIGT